MSRTLPERVVEMHRQGLDPEFLASWFKVSVVSVEQWIIDTLPASTPFITQAELTEKRERVEEIERALRLRLAKLQARKEQKEKQNRQFQADNLVELKKLDALDEIDTRLRKVDYKPTFGRGDTKPGYVAPRYLDDILRYHPDEEQVEGASAILAITDHLAARTNTLSVEDAETLVTGRTPAFGSFVPQHEEPLVESCPICGFDVCDETFCRMLLKRSAVVKHRTP